MSGNPVIALVIDDPFARDLYAKHLANGGEKRDIVTADSTAAARELVGLIDLALIDLATIPDAIALIDALKRATPSLPIVVVAGQNRMESALEAMRAGATDFVTHPVDPDVLRFIVSRALQSERLLRENATLRSHVELYRACQRITTQIDEDGLRTTTAEALLSHTGAQVAITFHHPGGETEPDVLAAVGASGSVPHAVARAAAPLVEPWPDDGLRVTPCPADDSPLGAALRENQWSDGLLVQIGGPSTPYCAVLLARKTAAPFTATDRDAAQFIARHALAGWQNVERYAAVRSQVYRDPLTGLFNAEYLRQAVDRGIRRHKVDGFPFAVLFIDLDHFKQVNDTHGHLIGSQLLVEVAKTIRHCVREDDVPVRYGGDEYVILLRDANLTTAMTIAERLRATLEKHTFLGRGGFSLHITGSIGVAAFPEHAGTAEGILDMADKAMYRGKAGSRNSVYSADALNETSDPGVHPAAI